jgi:hypothetical protein
MGRSSGYLALYYSVVDFVLLREAIPFDIEMDQKQFCMDEGEMGAPA